MRETSPSLHGEILAPLCSHKHTVPPTSPASTGEGADELSLRVGKLAARTPLSCLDLPRLLRVVSRLSGPTGKGSAPRLRRLCWLLDSTAFRTEFRMAMVLRDMGLQKAWRHGGDDLHSSRAPHIHMPEPKVGRVATREGAATPMVALGSPSPGSGQ